jgi:Zn ribbon nucleic-acid-binding protein
VGQDGEPQPDPDDRPPICPACGVTQGIVMDGDESEFVCLECGFSDRRDPASYEREA